MGLADRGQKKVNHPGAMKLENRLLDTGLDSLYNEVVKSKRATLLGLSMKFNVSPSKMEEWARVLDKQGLLSLHYPVVGEAELRAKENLGEGVKEFNKKLLLVPIIALLLGLMLILIKYFAG